MEASSVPFVINLSTSRREHFVKHLRSCEHSLLYMAAVSRTDHEHCTIAKQQQIIGYQTTEPRGTATLYHLLVCIFISVSSLIG